MTSTAILTEDATTIVAEEGSRFSWGVAIAGAIAATATTFFVHDGFMPEVASDAAILFGYVEAQQPCLPDEPPRLAIDVVLGAPAGFVRDHLGFYEPRNGIAECDQIIVHPVGGVLREHGAISLCTW